ncbi:MAG TPA: MerR family transcriptional regulator [Mobilitalea sp.]|nr:MerR family transcriptional regulator [Mobilitalea sp.]
MDLMKITDLTNDLGISSRSLRYYEQVRLISSVRPDFEKYRFYDAQNIERLKQIIVLRKMQIPIKDIIRIYESEDMSVVVEAFVDRINAIEDEVDTLTELKRIINDFLQTMIREGITKISALPLLYEEMDKQLTSIEEHKPVTYQELSAVSDKLAKPVDVRIIDIPEMRVLSSRMKGSDTSDVDAFWQWINTNRIPTGIPGRHEMFEYQNNDGQPVMILKIPDTFVKDSPYADYVLKGGLFAAGSVYVDEEIGEFHKAMVKSFDNNKYYEVDYQHDGTLRHESLVETVISPDDQREKVDIFVPVKKRLPDASHYDPNEQITSITVHEIEEANSILQVYNIPLNEITPILDPYYVILDTGEAEYIPYISKRWLSTNIPLKIPFRVDIEFKTDEASLRFFHDNAMFGINMDNNADSRKSQEALSFNQPIFGDYHSYRKLGQINKNQYNQLTWIVGEKHFAVIMNGEVRYCGINFPYMKSDYNLLNAYPIIIGSDGWNKIFLKSIRVSQLKHTKKIKIKKGELTMITKQSNNKLPIIHNLITMHYGENYWFNGCMRYLMECLDEKDFDYWFFAGITGDNLAQVYSYDHFRGDGATDYLLCPEFVKNIFNICGYECSYISEKELNSNKVMYLQTLMAYIDKGLPVIAKTDPWGVYVGYEENGKSLLYMSSDMTQPEKRLTEDYLKEDWIFAGAKKRDVNLKQIYRDVILDMPHLLRTKTDGYCFGAEAFRAWAKDIENGKFDDMKPDEFNAWFQYTIYICNLATNSGCCQSFLEKAQKLNPDLTFIEEIRRRYSRTGELWNDLEAMGAGFNITLDALQDKEKRKAIADKINEFAVCMDEVLAILDENLKK